MNEKIENLIANLATAEYKYAKVWLENYEMGGYKQMKAVDMASQATNEAKILNILKRQFEYLKANRDE